MLYGYNLAVVNSPAQVRVTSIINIIIMVIIILIAVVTADPSIKIIFMPFPRTSDIPSMNERLTTSLDFSKDCRHSQKQTAFHHIESCGLVYQIHNLWCV